LVTTDSMSFRILVEAGSTVRHVLKQIGRERVADFVLERAGAALVQANLESPILAEDKLVVLNAPTASNTPAFTFAAPKKSPVQ